MLLLLTFSRYIYNPLSECQERALAGAWDGCVNLTTLAAAEQRAYGWYWVYKNASGPIIRPSLWLNYSEVGTATGLTKLPYLRDGRRSIGLDGFRLFYSEMSNTTTVGYHFYDTVALGDYPVDIHPLNETGCVYPSYVHAVHPIGPYYIPFRALTNQDALNLLVSGKGIAQSFLANSATRLHPSEWTTGVAAGVAAVLMVQNGWQSTYAVLGDIEMLQAALQSDAIQQPLVWDL